MIEKKIREIQTAMEADEAKLQTAKILQADITSMRVSEQFLPPKRVYNLLPGQRTYSGGLDMSSLI